MSGHSRSHQVPRAPLHAQGVTSYAEMSGTSSANITLPSSLIRTHASILNPPTTSEKPERRVFAGCCQPLLKVGPSRRYLYESFSTCLNPYPGCSCGALTHFFPQNNGLPGGLSRSALSYIHTAISVWAVFRGCNYSFTFRPVDLLATQIAPTAVSLRHKAAMAFTSPHISVCYLAEQGIC
jgi:hypothetical protein